MYVPKFDIFEKKIRNDENKIMEIKKEIFLTLTSLRNHL